MTIKEALASNNPIDDITISGWVRTRRDSKGFSFLSINDGSCLANIQAIVDDGIPGSESISMATTGSSVKLKGQLVESPGKGQSFEIKASEIEVTGTADDTYPLQKKGHSPEFLREIAHLRPRSNLFGCVFRTRSRLAYAIHQFFQEKGFVYVHTPIITASDCEGAGEMFRVTTLDGNQTDKENDFFGKPTYLTVSGQLEVETFACALSNVYTFGPTFRAENSNTTRHASEFWMIEPEMAYCDLEGDMDLAEEMIQYLIKDTLEHCSEDLELFGKFVDKGLLERLHSVSNQAFQRISYTEAVKILENTETKFEYPVEWGMNLQTEHERFLTEEHFKSPVTVHDYPRSIKPFYMRINDDEKTSAAMDLLVPGIGEIIGGSQREERLDVLMENMEEHNISKDDYSWYSDLRRYGTVPHSGFGLGFERMLMFVTGVANIRDVIPFPRTPGSANF
jgi:asparaginyl-tRNA synthetase